MTSDFRIDIASNGGGLVFNLYQYVAGVQSAALVFQRQPLDLSGSPIDKLRRGDAVPAEVQQISATVSSWLFGTDVGPLLFMALNQVGGEPVRLIFSINDAGLREQLADAPFELCQLQGAAIPLALNGRNASVFHLLPKVGTSSPSAGTWPLRILIVRSNPLDLGGAIPPAALVRDAIFEPLDNQGLSRSLVQVHILSSEVAPDIAGRPTRDGFRSQINKGAAYHILLYLGHGDVLPVYTGMPPVNVLQLESDDGANHVTVPSDQLAVFLHERPVPVALLIGCLTAAGVPADLQAGVGSAIPQWIRGVQGLAQALVNSESGMQLAVGTRYMLETVDAVRFLKAFFASLLQSKPGNVEAAVHAARRDMHFGTPGSYSWSAPIVFRNLQEEPIFPFLASPPANVCPTADQQQNLRVIFWENLSKQSWSLRDQNPASIAMIHNVRETVEQQYLQTILANAPALIMPKLVEGKSEQTINIEFDLYGALNNIDELRGTLTVGGAQVKIVALQATPELANGFNLLSSVTDNQASFMIERRVAGSTLKNGPIFTATVQLDTASQVVYPVNLTITRTSSAQPVCTGNNAVIVPAP